jgi:hypothetical protein
VGNKFPEEMEIRRKRKGRAKVEENSNSIDEKDMGWSILSGSCYLGNLLAGVMGNRRNTPSISMAMTNEREDSDSRCRGPEG